MIDVMMNIPLDKRKLAADAVPALNIIKQPFNDHDETHCENRRLVVSAVAKYEENLRVEHLQLALAQAPKSVSTQTDPAYESEFKRKIKVLERELKLERVAKAKLNERVQSLQQLKDTISHWLSPGVIRRAETGKNCHFNDADIAAAIPLHNAGPRMYRLLRKRGCPLPGQTTLQRWAQRVSVNPGIINHVVPIIKKAALTTLQKLCVLSFDEVKLREEVDYLKMTDTVILPKRYAQVMMVRGLCDNWKQVIYYNFDTNMTKDILMSVINLLEKNGLIVVATVSDLRPTNRALFNQLNVNHVNPCFKTDSGRDVFVFSDAPHLLKCLRNHFVDKGFINDGIEYSVNPILDILRRDNGDLRICPRLLLEHVTVTGAGRQKVKYAARLFSHNVSQALLVHGGPTAAPTASLFKLIDEWFDVENVQQIQKDSRKRTHAFGLQLDIQMEILDKTTKFFTEARVKGKKEMQPFQKGILMNNKALPLLLESLKQYGVKYIITRRLNQDCLESFFGVIRSRGGLHDHPSPKEFTYRLRNCILGKVF